MQLRSLIVSGRHVLEALDDLALDDVAVVATAEFPRFSMIVELVRSRSGEGGLSVTDLPKMDRWSLGNRNGEPYIVRVRVKDFSDVEVARCHLSWWGVGSCMKGDSVFVARTHRRMGIASAMYALAGRVIGESVLPSPFQTPDGRSLWEGILAARGVPAAA